MIIEKVCIVCGKSFLAANPLYCICDDECRAKRKTVYKKRYEKTHAEAIREQRRKRNEKYREQHTKAKNSVRGQKMFCIAEDTMKR